MMEGGAQVARNAISLAAARVAVQAGSALLFFFMGWRLGFSQLGVYAAAISFYQIVAIGGGAASAYLVREIARRPSETYRLLRILKFLVFAGGGSLVTVGVVAIELLPTGHRLTIPVAVAAFAVVPNVIVGIQEGVFVAYGRASLQAIVSVAAAAFNTGVGFVLLFLGAGVTWLLLLFVFTQLLAAVVGHLLIARVIAPARTPLEHSLFREGLHVIRDMRAFLGSGLLAGLFARPETLVLALVASPAQAGYFGAALKVVDLWQFVPSTLMLVVFPLLSRAFATSRERAVLVQREALRALLALSLPIGALTFVGAGQIAALYGDAAGRSALSLRVLALNFTLNSLAEVFWRVLSARGDQARVLRVQVITTVSRLLSGTILIAAFGVLGAAIAVVMNMVLYVALTGRQITLDGSRIGLARLAARPFAAAVVAGALAAVLLWLSNIFVALPAGAIAYCALAWRFSIVRHADLVSLRTASPRAVADGH